MTEERSSVGKRRCASVSGGMGPRRECQREVYRGNLCICHCPDEDKDRQLFQSALARAFADPGPGGIDLAKFVFPAGKWTIPKTFHCDVIADDTRFLGSVDMSGCRFEGNVSFKRVEFEQDITFDATAFYGRVDFSKSTFGGLGSFQRVEFVGPVEFRFVELGADALFSSGVFHEDTVFLADSFELVSFTGSDFKKRLHVAGHLNGRSDFSRCRFGLASQFKGLGLFNDVSFDSCTFAGEEHLFSNWMKYRRHPLVFTGELLFRNVCINPGAWVTFRWADLRRANFEDSDLSRVKFVEVRRSRDR